MIKINQYHYLFYSGNFVATEKYAVGVARSSNGPLGPFEKNPSNPILAMNEKWWGPGHCSVLQLEDGSLLMMYHSWNAGQMLSNDSRLIMMDTMVLDENLWPKMLSEEAPTSTPQPVP